MTFAYGHLLHLLWLVPMTILFFLWAARRRRRALTRLVRPMLSARLTSAVSRRRRVWKVLCIVLALLAIVLALARPQYGRKLRIIQRRGIDIVIALDTSDSMQAEDIKPNRLQRAKQEISALIDRLRGDRVALVAFAGEAFVQCPLTSDYEAAKMFLDIIDQSIEPGTAIRQAIHTGISVFQEKDRKYKAIILITDGEDHHSDPLEAAQAAAQEGIRIYAIGVGTPGGVPIPIRDEQGDLVEYKKNRQGETVLSRLDEVTLQRIALETKGRYYRATTGEMELEGILEELKDMEKKELASREYDLREDRYQYFVLAAVILLTIEAALGDRKRNVHNAATQT
jgi:Ca-activated chloride channel family protein